MCPYPKTVTGMQSNFSAKFGDAVVSGIIWKNPVPSIKDLNGTLPKNKRDGEGYVVFVLANDTAYAYSYGEGWSAFSGGGGVLPANDFVQEYFSNGIRKRDSEIELLKYTLEYLVEKYGDDISEEDKKLIEEKKNPYLS
jgi:hypothetical protein